MRKTAFLKRTFVDHLEMRPSTILLSAVILILVLALLGQHQRAIKREVAILERADFLQGIVNERIREKSRENEILKLHLESLKPSIDRQELDVRDRLPGLDVSVTDAWKKSNIVTVATYLGCSSPYPWYVSHSLWDYSCAGLKVKETLKGVSVEGESMKTSFWLNERRELPPDVGKDYIFFIERTKRGYRAIKVLQNKIWNVQAIRKCIAMTGPPRD